MATRILDAVLRYGVKNQLDSGLRSVVADLAPRAVPIDVTPVEQLFTRQMDDLDRWDWTSYPNVMPPFDVTWFEVAEGQCSETRGFGWGVLTRVERTEPNALFAVVTAFTFVSPSGSLPVGPMAAFTYIVGPTGEMDGDIEGYDYYAKWARLDELPAKRLQRRLLVPVLLGISFTHCKNVTLVDAPDRRTRQQIRRDERAGVEPVRFKTLDIRPMRKVLEDEGQAATVGMQRALHICRGHFATYSPDKPLFGKHAGTFWVPAHVRGNADRGVVAKDYRVLPA